MSGGSWTGLTLRDVALSKVRPDVATVRRYQVGLSVRCVACHGRVVGELPDDHGPGRLFCMSCGRTICLLARNGGF